MKPEILTKLKAELDRGIVTEPQALYFMSGVRNLLESGIDVLLQLDFTHAAQKRVREKGHHTI
jgi:hypothetical protein